MIGLAAYDRAGAVELFREHEPREFVRKCPWCQRQPACSVQAHAVTESMRTANDKGNILCAVTQVRQPVGKRFRRECLPSGIARHDLYITRQPFLRRMASRSRTCVGDAEREDSSFTSTTSSGQYRAARVSYSWIASARAFCRGRQRPGERRARQPDSSGVNAAEPVHRRHAADRQHVRRRPHVHLVLLRQLQHVLEAAAS